MDASLNQSPLRTSGQNPAPTTQPKNTPKAENETKEPLREPSWLEARLGIPPARLDSTTSNNTLDQCFKTFIDIGDIDLHVMGDFDGLADAHIVIANHQSCLDMVGMYLALRRNADWVIPVANENIVAPNGSHDAKDVARKALQSLGRGNISAALQRVQSALVRFPVLFSALPMITVKKDLDDDDITSPDDADETVISEGTQVIAERKTHDNQIVNAPASQNITARKQQLCLFPQGTASKHPPQAGDYNTQAIALWDKTSTPDAPTKLSSVTINYPNGTVPSIVGRKILSWLTGQRFHNAMTLHVDSPMTYQECARRVNTEMLAPHEIEEKEKKDNQSNFPQDLAKPRHSSIPSVHPPLTPIPENIELEDMETEALDDPKNETQGQGTHGDFSQFGMAKHTRTIQRTPAETYQAAADYLAQQTRLNLKYIHNQGRYLNPSNTANYAKAFCRLFLMGATATMVDWVQRNKLSPLLPTDALESGVSRAVITLMTLAMMRYAFSGTARAER